MFKVSLFVSYIIFIGAVLTAETSIAQSNQSNKDNNTYSNPIAPLGNKSLTVPPSVKTMLDVWMRDVFYDLRI